MLQVSKCQMVKVETLQSMVFFWMSPSTAKALWLQLKQFKGYCGRPECKEKGEQHIIGICKGGKERQCHIYPYNASFPDFHCLARSHSEVRKQALQALQNRKNGMKSVSLHLHLILTALNSIEL